MEQTNFFVEFALEKSIETAQYAHARFSIHDYRVFRTPVGAFFKIPGQSPIHWFYDLTSTDLFDHLVLHYIT